MWKFNTDGNPLQEVDVHKLIGEDSKILAFAFTEKQLIADADRFGNTGTAVKGRMKAIVVQYMSKKLCENRV